MVQGCGCNTAHLILLVSKDRAMCLKEALDEGNGCASCCNKNRDTLLIIAAKNGNLNVAEILLQHLGVDYLEHFNKTGKRALHEAAQHGQLELVEWLLGRGATVDSLKQADWTPLMLAAEKANLPIVRCLLARGANPSLVNKDGWNALHIAARADAVPILELLHEHSTQLIGTVSRNGRTPLHSAALNCSYAACRWLLDHGTSVNAADRSGLTPLMDAARMGHRTVCDLLVERGADILQLDAQGRTALHHTTQADQLLMVEWCVTQGEEAARKHGSPIKRRIFRTRSMENMVPRPTRTTVQRTSTTRERRPAFINWRSEQGSTALHYAAKESLSRMVETLLKLGANRTLKDNFGRLPRDMTSDEGIISLLS